MKRILSTISVVFVFTALTAQQIILNEDFKDNKNKWQIELSDPDERASISSGRYDLQTLSKTNWHYFTIERKFDEEIGFTIESVITKLPRKDKYQKINATKAKEILDSPYRTYARKYYNSVLKGLQLIDKYQDAGVRFNVLTTDNTYQWFYATTAVTEEIKGNQDISNAIGFIDKHYKEGSKNVIYNDEYLGLLWGCDGNTKLFSFNIIPDMQVFQVISLINGTWTTLIDWTTSDKILSGNSANKLTVASLDGTLYFLINDNPVGKSPFQQFYGYNVGFFVGPETHISVDNLTIKGYEESVTGESSSGEYKSSGSGFIISEQGYIVTNHHVIEDAKEIWVEINQDGKKKEFKAKVAIQDKNNDLAILKVDNELFPKPIFGFKTLTTDVGSSVFAMGYPLISVLGDEIKITDGIISSKTGYQGDISTYQISAPIQPGNSGGPLFDKKGYLIGITNAGIPGAENVGYAIKTSYLQNLIELLSDKVELSPVSKLENSGFTDQIKQLSKFVTIIKTK